MEVDELKRALAQPGRSQAALARHIGLPDASYVNKILHGGRKIQAKELPKIADYLAQTAGDHMGNQSDTVPVRDSGAGDLIQVPEYNVHLSAGPGMLPDFEEVRRTWPLPRFFVVDSLGMKPGSVAIQEIIGDSMSPTLVSGDYVLIDLADQRLGLDGIFALWNGDALVCKRLEVIPSSEPVKARIMSDNPRHNEYEVLAEGIRVIGRVRMVIRRQ